MNITASDKQLAYITTLATSRDLTASTYEPALKAIAAEVLTNPASLTKAAASKAIDMMVRLPYINTKTAQAPDKKAGLEVGFYEMDKNIYKVVRSPQTGNLYAKKFTTDGFEYATGAVYHLKTKGIALTLEAAKAYGHIYGMCVICGRTLTDEQSIEMGIGPICASKF